LSRPAPRGKFTQKVVIEDSFVKIKKHQWSFSRNFYVYAVHHVN